MLPTKSGRAKRDELNMTNLGYAKVSTNKILDNTALMLYVTYNVILFIQGVLIMKKNRKRMTIGELSAQTGVTRRTIHFYIQEGLLPEPERPHKNIAYYDEKFIEMIASIKKAQKERFLPLVVIRNILKQNNFDYSTLLEAPEDSKKVDNKSSEKISELESVKTDNFPEEVIQELSSRKWIKSDSRRKKKVYSYDEAELLKLVTRLHQNGVPLKSVTTFFEHLESVVENLVEEEIEYLLAWTLGNKLGDINELWELEKKSILTFSQRAWEKQWEKSISRRINLLDNMYLATADEGFGIPAEELKSQLDAFEANIPNNPSKVRAFMDLATGYSIIGDLERSQHFHRKALKLAPLDPEVQIRALWYRRFSRRPGDINRLKKEAQKIVDKHPEYALAHAFLALWLIIDINNIEDNQVVLSNINRSLEELNLADRLEPINNHNWVLVNYIQGRVYTELLGMSKHMDQGINAFEKILKRKTDLDWYYDGRMPFFSKWLWPNLYFFLGASYLKVGRKKEAYDVLEKARHYKMMPTFYKRIDDLLNSERTNKLISANGGGYD